jgi:hypothetical protein
VKIGGFFGSVAHHSGEDAKPSRIGGLPQIYLD